MLVLATDTLNDPPGGGEWALFLKPHHPTTLLKTPTIPWPSTQSKTTQNRPKIMIIFLLILFRANLASTSWAPGRTSSKSPPAHSQKWMYGPAPTSKLLFTCSVQSTMTGCCPVTTSDWTTSWKSFWKGSTFKWGPSCVVFGKCQPAESQNKKNEPHLVLKLFRPQCNCLKNKLFLKGGHQFPGSQNPLETPQCLQPLQSTPDQGCALHPAKRGKVRWHRANTDSAQA